MFVPSVQAQTLEVALRAIAPEATILGQPVRQGIDSPLREHDLSRSLGALELRNAGKNTLIVVFDKRSNCYQKL